MEKDLILKGRPCWTDFSEDGPETVEEAEKSKYSCGLLDACTKSPGWICLNRLSLEVARNVIIEQKTLDEVMEDGFLDFLNSLPERQEFRIFIMGKGIGFFHGKKGVIEKVREEAERLLRKV